MDDFPTLVKTVMRVALFFLSFCLFGWVFSGSYQATFAGLMLGTVVSVVNSRYLAWKIDGLTQAVTGRTNRRINLGFVTRVSLALLAVVIAVKYEQHFQLTAVLAGLFFTQLVTLLLGILSLFSSKNQ